MLRASRRLRPPVLALLAGVVGGAHATTLPPPVGRVFVIVLENQGFEKRFGPDSKAPYFSKTLTKLGVLLTPYFGAAHDRATAQHTGDVSGVQTAQDRP